MKRQLYFLCILFVLISCKKEKISDSVEGRLVNAEIPEAIEKDSALLLKLKNEKDSLLRLAELRKAEKEVENHQVEKNPQALDRKKSRNNKKKPLEPKKEREITSAKLTPNVTPAKVEIPKESLTEMVFKRNFFSFGEIIEGDTISFKYSYTNIGEHPLIIKDVTATCGCSQPSFTFVPIAPGESGEITGIYVSAGKNGPQNAMLKVVANTDPSIFKLYMDGEVVPRKEKEKENTKEDQLDEDLLNEQEIEKTEQNESGKGN